MTDSSTSRILSRMAAAPCAHVDEVRSDEVREPRRDGPERPYRHADVEIVLVPADVASSP